MEIAACCRKHCVEVLAAQKLSQQKTQTQEPSAHFTLDQLSKFGGPCLFCRPNKRGPKLGLSRPEILKQQGFTFDADHYSRHDHVARCAKDPGCNDEVKSDH